MIITCCTVCAADLGNHQASTVGSGAIQQIIAAISLWSNTSCHLVGDLPLLAFPSLPNSLDGFSFSSLFLRRGVTPGLRTRITPCWSRCGRSCTQGLRAAALASC